MARGPLPLRAMGLRDEILEQPVTAWRQLRASEEQLAAVAARVREQRIESVVIAARGTSDHAAIYGQYLLGIRNRLPVALAAPSITSLYGVEPRFSGALVVGISQSGASPDVVGVVAAARRQGAPTLAITNEPASPLAAAAEFVMELAAGPERAVAATKTYTTSLLALARLSVALAGDDPASLAGVPDQVDAALATEPVVEALARELVATDRCLVLGRGYEYGTAREWGLKLKELARVFADPYSSADFRHGPMALAAPEVPALAILPEGPPMAGLADVLRDLREARTRTVVLSEVEATRSLAWRSVALPSGVPDWLRPISSIVPGQLFAYHLTVAKGLDPEAPRAISKVTRTT